jgi:hypothetical protein
MKIIERTWDAGVILQYQSLLETEDLQTAERYLDVINEIDTNPTVARQAIIFRQRRNSLSREVLVQAVQDLLSPTQTPLSAEAVWIQLCDLIKIEINYPRLRQICNDLADVDLLRKLRDPFRGGRYVYCSYEFTTQPQIGDKVLEFVRSRSRRSGVIVDFKLHQQLNKVFPVAQWSSGGLAFANPENLIILERG